MKSDLISRQEAIDAIEKYDFSFPDYMERFAIKLRDAMKEDLKDDIADLPSAQPEIIYCKDCKFAWLTDNGEAKYCDVWSPDDEVYMDAKINFCSYGERKEGNNDE